MAKNDVVQMPKKEKSADVNSLGDFLIKNKVVLTLSAPGFYQIYTCCPFLEVLNFNTVLLIHA